MNKITNKWDKYWKDMCNMVASNSSCLSRQIGAVVVKDGKYLVSTGYNGPAKGCAHCDNFDYRAYLYAQARKDSEAIPVSFKRFMEASNVCPRQLLGYTSGQGLQYCQAAHAERNAIDLAAKLGHCTEGCTMYMNCPISCMECAKSVANAGIKEIVVSDAAVYEKCGITGRDILTNAGVSIRVFNLEGI